MNRAISKSKAQSFRGLQVWQRSMELAVAVYRLTERLPREESFGLTGQLRRSSVSIPSNVTEGFNRLNRREFKRHLLIARGSNCELQTQLEIAGSLSMANPEHLKVAAASDEVARMLLALLTNLKSG